VSGYKDAAVDEPRDEDHHVEGLCEAAAEEDICQVKWSTLKSSHQANSSQGYLCEVRGEEEEVEHA
jgi:hypothetical protein